MSYTFEPIGIIHSCYHQKFGIPRQARLVPEAGAVLELVPPYNRPESVIGLDEFSHLWIVFVLHRYINETWKPTVRPPRLGGNRRIGVFASRSGFRPNPIGMSAVELVQIRHGYKKLFLDLKGVDLLDGTPVLDIKPYIPYADRITSAIAGFADEPPDVRLQVAFTPEALQTCRELEEKIEEPVEAVIAQSLQYDPRPAYYGQESIKQFGTIMFGMEVKWRVEEGRAVVYSITSP